MINNDTITSMMTDTEIFRQKVIDAGIQGKLTEQLPEDGNSEDLYQKIQTEKAKLVKEGKIKKSKPLPKIKTEEISFEIPKSWKWVRLGDLFDHNTGKALNSSDKDGSLLTYITTSNVYWDHFELNNLKSMYFNESEIDKCTIQKGDLLICEGGDIGRSAIWPYKQEIRIQNHLHRLRPFLSEELNVKFYYYVMWSYKLNGLINGRGIGLQGFSSKRVHSLIVPFPPVTEQKRIVDRIDEILGTQKHLAKSLEEYSSNVEVLRSKVIDAGIQGKLTKQLPEDGNAENLYKKIVEEKEEILIARNGRKDKNIMPVGTDVPFTIPKNWKWLRLGDIGFFKKGPFGSALTKSMFVPKGHDTVKVYEQQHAIKKNKKLGTYYIKRDYFESKMRGFEVRPGDIIVSCAGTIGESYIMPDDIEQGIINQALMRVTLVPSVNKQFFQYYFDSNLKQLAQINGNGSAITNIPPFEVLKKWYFPLPPVSEQIRIVDKISEILDEI